MTLVRRTPLRTDPAKLRDWQRRSRKPLRSVGAKAKREAPDLDAFRKAVHARRWCELETPACPPYPHPGRHAHHVWPSDRDIGIHEPERGLLVCAAGHQWVHDHPEISYERGWLGRAS